MKSPAISSPGGADGPPAQPGAPTLEAVMGRAGSENFPVALRLLAPDDRAALMAIYGFARLADDIGDEAPGDRLALLDWLEGQLDAVVGGGDPEHPLMRALGGALATHPLPDGPFRRLIEANRIDQSVARYRTFDELLGYCRLSATPVGELVLGVFGAATPDRIELSDRICSALQVIEHLQDVAEDLARGRVYIPQQDLERFGCEDEDLAGPAASQSVRRLIAFEATRAAGMLHAGAPLSRSLAPRARIAVAAFVAGGRAALAGIARAGFDTVAGAPPLRKAAFATGWAGAMRGT